jgi:chromosome segregation ATPase
MSDFPSIHRYPDRSHWEEKYREAQIEIERLRRELDYTTTERETYNGYHQAACLEIERLRATTIVQAASAEAIAQELKARGEEIRRLRAENEKLREEIKQWNNWLGDVRAVTERLEVATLAITKKAP